MKYALLVAWREYSENAKAKGFWISLFLMPAMIFLSIQAPIWLEQKATPVRHYVLVDQSGSLAPAIEAALEKSYQRRVLDSLQDYARKYALPQAGATVFARQPGPEAAEDENPRAVNSFVNKGGQAAFLEKLRPRLKPGAPAFEAPRRAFQAVPLPPGLDSHANFDSLADALKPYLRAEQKIAAEGRPVELAAAILIPGDIETHIVRPATNHAAVGAARQVQYWS